MTRISQLISRYLISAIIPYFASSWMLLSVILFILQAGRYADIFFGVNVPSNLVWQLTIALIPNVIAFTCPTALLIGTVIGLSKMQGDSELVAIRAAGVGNFQIALPIVVLGILLSAFAFVVNENGVPAAAGLVRRVGLESAIQKLESPLEPGAFNTEIAGYTIFARGGDVETGRWTDLFVYREDSQRGIVRLVTSKSGRIDTTDENSELVLEDASALTLPLVRGAGTYVTEKIGDVRFGIKTRRAEMIDKLLAAQALPEELSLSQLSAYAVSHEGREGLEARILWQRRLLLSFSPLIFCILGTMMVLRFNRGGRGFGSLLALIGIIGFYAVGFLAEQMVRTGSLPVWTALAFPVTASILAFLFLGISGRMTIGSRMAERFARVAASLPSAPDRLQKSNLFVDLTTGLRDFDIIRNLISFYLLTLCFLASLMLIFTAFELWKFAGALPNGTALLGRYLLYFLPLVYMQVTTPAAMIATLATYVIKSRQNEVVTWASAGQSVYRLLLPCLLLAAALGGINYATQEYVLPGSNVIQDEARERLQNKGDLRKRPGRVWVAEANHIFSFRRAEGTSLISPASDNAVPDPSCPSCSTDLWVYEFESNNTKLQSVYRAASGSWESGRAYLRGNVEVDSIVGNKVSTSTVQGTQITVASNPFVSIDERAGHLDTKAVRQQLIKAGSDLEQRRLAIAIEKKAATFLLPLVSVLIVAPFALSLSHKGKAASVALAIGLWLAFATTAAIFEQIGLNGLLSPSLAVWAPIAMFTLIGIYLLSRVRS